MWNHFNGLLLLNVLFASGGSDAFIFRGQPSTTHVYHAGCRSELGASSRRDFLAENIAVSLATMTAFTPQLVNAEEEGGKSLIDQAAERIAERSSANQARMAEKKAEDKLKKEYGKNFFDQAADFIGERSASNQARTAEKKAKDKLEKEEALKEPKKPLVERIQEGIAEGKERARSLDEQETKRTEENEFINTLKARSAANKDEYKRQSMGLAAPNKKPSYTGLRRSDGSIKMVTSEELKELEKDNKIKSEYEVRVGSDGKEYTDYSKRVLFLLDDESTQPTSNSQSSSSEPVADAPSSSEPVADAQQTPETNIEAGN